MAEALLAVSFWLIANRSNIIMLCSPTELAYYKLDYYAKLQSSVMLNSLNYMFVALKNREESQPVWYAGR